MTYYEGIVDIYYQNSWDLNDAWSRGIRVVLHRTSSGIKKLKKERDAYTSRKAAALNKGMLWGGYHFLTGDDIDAQLALFLSIEDASNRSVAMAIDFEKNPGGNSIDIDGVRAMVRKFNAAMKLRGYPNRYPILYGGNKIREALGGAPRDSLLANCPLWYVCWNKAAADGSIDTSDPDHPWPKKTWPNYTLWQYDDEKRLHGSPPSSMIHPGENPVKVLPGADWNRYKGSLDDLKKVWPFAGS